MRRLALLAALLLLALPAAARAVPYTGVTSIGDRAGGQLRLPQGVAVDRAGEVFVADQYSGAIQRFGADGAFQLAFGAPGGGDGQFGPVVGLAYDPSDDTIYAADAVNDRIQHFRTDGTFLGAFGSRGSGPGQLSLQDGGPVEDPAQGGLDVGGGKLWVADAGNDRVDVFPLADVSGDHPTSAHATTLGEGALANPQGLDAAADGRLYVADDLHDVVRIYDQGSGQELGTLGQGLGTGPGQFDGLWDVVRGLDGRIYVVDDNNSRIQVFDQAVSLTQPVQVLGGFGRDPGRLEFPRSIALGPDGSLVVANTADGRVDQFATTGTILRSFGQDARLPGQFLRPAYLGAAPDGGLGVPDMEANRVQLFGPGSDLLGVYGRVGAGADQVRRPEGIAFAADFSSWTADTGNDRVVLRNAFGAPVRTYGSQGSSDGELDAPFATAVDATGAVFVADEHNDRVVKLRSDGTLQATFDGIPGPRGLAVSPTNGRLYVASGDGDRVEVLDPSDGHEVDRFGTRGTGDGQLSTPGGVAVDPAGRVYVVDLGDDRVERFSADGDFQLAFGERGTDLGQLERPTGVAVTCDGRVAVADSENDRVQRFSFADAPTSPCAQRPVLPAPAPPAPAPAPPVETPAPVPSADPTPAPARKAIVLSVQAGRRTALLRRRSATVVLRCPSACTVRVGASVRTAAGRRVTRTLRSRTLALRAGRRTTAALRLTTADVRALRRALGRRTALRLVVRVRASAASRRTTTRTRTITARA